jgi:hypothetical protein
MPSKLTPLLCELHAHTTWSDGVLSPRELCDLYGRAGFDVLAVTDHTMRDVQYLGEANFGAYLADLTGEAERARVLYDMVVIPGLELTYEDPDPSLGAHALALGLREFVGIGDGLEPALRAARAQGAALVAAHPYRLEEVDGASRQTAAFAKDPGRWMSLVDRVELFNRETFFSWVAEAALPAVACGDFHVREHLTGWKTMLPCQKDESSVIAYLRSSCPAFLVCLARQASEVACAA